MVRETVVQETVVLDVGTAVLSGGLGNLEIQPPCKVTPVCEVTPAILHGIVSPEERLRTFARVRSSTKEAGDKMRRPMKEHCLLEEELKDLLSTESFWRCSHRRARI